MSKQLKNRPGLLALFAAFSAVYLIWGSTYLGIRIAIDSLPPFIMAGTRFLLAGAIVYAFMHWRGETRPTRRHWINAAIVGGCLLLGGNGLICWAQLNVPTGLAALLVATVPLWMVLLDWIMFRGPRPTMLIALGLAFGLAGIVVLVNPKELLGEPIHVGGAIAILAACVSWAFGSLYSRRAALPASAFVATGMEMMCGGALLLAVGLARGEAAQIKFDAITMDSIWALAYLIVFGSLVGYSAYIWLLTVVSPAAVSTYAYVNPIVAVLLGWAYRNEPIEPRTIGAGALILTAVLLITARAGRAARERTSTIALNENRPATRPGGERTDAQAQVTSSGVRSPSPERELASARTPASVSQAR